MRLLVVLLFTITPILIFVIPGCLLALMFLLVIALEVGGMLPLAPEPVEFALGLTP